MELVDDDDVKVDDTFGTDDFPISSRKNHNATKNKYLDPHSQDTSLLNKDQKRALDMVLSGKNVHIAGAAGIVLDCFS